MPQDADSSIKTVMMANEVLLPEVVRLLNEGHTVTLPLRGYSMRPFLEDGRDNALLKKATDVSVGDAVLAEIAPRHYVLHRIVKIEGQHVTLRGDGNLNVEHCRLSPSASTARGGKRLTSPTGASGTPTPGYGCDCCPCAAICWLSTAASG